MVRLSFVDDARYRRTLRAEFAYPEGWRWYAYSSTIYGSTVYWSQPHPLSRRVGLVLGFNRDKKWLIQRGFVEPSGSTSWDTLGSVPAARDAVSAVASALSSWASPRFNAETQLRAIDWAKASAEDKEIAEYEDALRAREADIRLHERTAYQVWTGSSRPGYGGGGARDGFSPSAEWVSDLPSHIVLAPSQIERLEALRLKASVPADDFRIFVQTDLACSRMLQRQVYLAIRASQPDAPEELILAQLVYSRLASAMAYGSDLLGLARHAGPDGEFTEALVLAIVQLLRSRRLATAEAVIRAISDDEEKLPTVPPAPHLVDTARKASAILAESDP
jgi:hypothetical protein